MVEYSTGTERKTRKNAKMLKDYFIIAVGGLRKRFLRTSLTMIGIFIGIAAVVALISLGQGMTNAINSQFSSLGTDKIIAQGVQAGFGPPGQNAPSSSTQQISNGRNLKRQ